MNQYTEHFIQFPNKGKSRSIVYNSSDSIYLNYTCTACNLHYYKHTTTVVTGEVGSAYPFGAPELCPGSLVKQDLLTLSEHQSYVLVFGCSIFRFLSIMQSIIVYLFVLFISDIVLYIFLDLRLLVTVTLIQFVVMKTNHSCFVNYGVCPSN